MFNHYIDGSTGVFYLGDQLVGIEYGFLPIEYLIIGGGGSGGATAGGGAGGGGAGGYLDGSMIITASTYTITVGAGGVQNTSTYLGNGGNSSAFGLTAIGGGTGGSSFSNNLGLDGQGGGSGGGAPAKVAVNDPNRNPGIGTVGQGFAGGNDADITQTGGGGGGGASEVGDTVLIPSGIVTQIGNGGNGKTWVDGVTRGGGGGGSGGAGSGAFPSPFTGGGGDGGLGGGGAGADDNGASFALGAPGTANTGGGGGGSYLAWGANGGSGIVIVRYLGVPKATGGTITFTNGYTYHSFTSTGSATFKF